MNTTSHSAQAGDFLSGTYARIRRITIVLGIVATITATALFGWIGGLVLAAGSLVGYLNFAWLHHAASIMTKRMVAPAGESPSKFRLVLSFAGRYIFVIATAYVIFKGYPRMFVGFSVALAFPVLAAMSEGIYEAFVNSGTDQISS